MESLIPNIFVRDMHATIEFYSLLGFTVTMSVPDEGDFNWVMMANGNVTIMFQTFDSLRDELPEIARADGGSLLLYCKVKNIRSLFSEISGNVNIVKGLEKTFFGATEFSIKDCNNYILTFAEDE